MEKFAYCPICGSKHFVIHSFKSKQCQDCGFVYFANPCAATAAFIMNGKGELLVVRRAKDPAKGTLDLPGGFVDMYETAEEGMRREIREETGLEVGKLEYLFSSPVDDDVVVKAADDAAECLWIALDKVRPEEFGLLSIRHSVERFLASKC